jgi:hypothetical protein
MVVGDSKDNASLKTSSENLLELRNVLKVHERVVLPGHVSVCRIAAAIARPWLQLVDEPVARGSCEENGIENVECG